MQRSMYAWAAVGAVVLSCASTAAAWPQGFWVRGPEGPTIYSTNLTPGYLSPYHQTSNQDPVAVAQTARARLNALGYPTIAPRRVTPAPTPTRIESTPDRPEPRE